MYINFDIIRRDIHSLSDEGFVEQLSRYQQALKKTGKGRHQIRELKRSLIFKKYGKNGRRTYTKQELFLIRNNTNKKESLILEQLYPKRNFHWKNFNKRDATAQEIDVKDFSFIDNPQETLKIFQNMAEAESNKALHSCTINFWDSGIRDISPYLLLGSVMSQMFPFFSGGHMEVSLKHVVRDLQLDKDWKINLRDIEEPDPNILALPVLRKEHIEQENKEIDTGSAREKVATKIRIMFDQWLSVVSDQKISLSEYGRSYLWNIISEVLDNAERHAIINSERSDGKWSVTCFMEYKKESNDYTCCMSFFNVGASIAETIGTSTDPSMTSRLRTYIAKHKHYDEELLTTVFALQDNSTRKNGESVGGYGLMSMVNFIQKMGKTNKPEHLPKIVIISGHSYVKFADGYIVQNYGDVAGNRYQWFNKSNSEEEPPDAAYIFRLQGYIPGTIITTRFSLDKDILTNERNNGTANN